MAKRYFITGTDTEVGKTFVTALLLKAFKSQGFSTQGFKPVASGSFRDKGILLNEDIEQIRKFASVQNSYEIINLYLFEPPIAPHIAAKLAGTTIDLQRIASHIMAHQEKADITLIEGVGGWLAPLNDTKTVANLAQLLGYDIILVVGMKLGCLNHALLTAQSIENHGLQLKGWVANASSVPMSYMQENIATLRQHIPAPLLGTLPRFQDNSDFRMDTLLDLTIL